MTSDPKTTRQSDKADMVARARRHVEMEFRRRTAHVGDVQHRMNPPLEVEAALDPALDWPWAEPIRPH